MGVVGVDVGRKYDQTVAIRAKCGVVDAFGVVGHDFRFREQAETLTPVFEGVSLITVDCTGIGQGLFEELEYLGLPVVRTVIVAGDKVNLRKDGITVGKSWLMQRCKARPVMIDPTLQGAMMLKEELQNIRVRLTGRGRVVYEPRTGHDDFVLAYALTLLARDLEENGFKARLSAEGPQVRRLEAAGRAEEGR